MPGVFADPIAAMSPIERWAMQFRFWRALRDGRAGQRTAILDALAPHLGHDPVVAARPSRRGPGAVGEITLASGTELRLAACSRPHLAQLDRLSREGTVILDRAAHHGNRWGLYFAGGGERLPLLVEDISVRSASGGGRRRLLQPA